ncbi:MAG: beta-N-acetylhexosaminidase [Phenylobacterium sp.]|jgi:beta-N-acetylhexosaminidase
MGPLMLDLTGCELDQEEKELLKHPTVGGVILFTRNYDSPKQIQELVAQIRLHAADDILVGVDHEGGRVQRFREGFSAIPAMGSLYHHGQQDLTTTRQLAQEMGWLLATEVRAVGIDITFAPVLDINGVSQVIGDRGFHQDPELIVAIASEFINGMNAAGMLAIGKHFPGHGNVLEDSHIAIPVDNRPKEAIFQLDMAIFKRLIDDNKLAGMMPAHVIYPAVDDLASGFSPIWLQQILKKQLGFNGVVFSDALDMAGAAVMGSFADRASQVLTAGCDMAVVCNDRAGAVQVLDQLPIENDQQLKAQLKAKLMTLSVSASTSSVSATMGEPLSWQKMLYNERWCAAKKLLDGCY